MTDVITLQATPMSAFIQPGMGMDVVFILKTTACICLSRNQAENTGQNKVIKRVILREISNM
jgi:hypothetical protein